MRVVCVAILAAFASHGAEIAGAGVVAQESRRTDGVVAQDGALRVVCDADDGWAFSLKRLPGAESGVCEYRLVLECGNECRPPAFTVEVRSPKTDMQYFWTPVFGCNGRIPLPEWTTWFAVQRSLPLVHRFNGQNRNRLTLAVSEARKDIAINAGIDEHDFNVVDRIRFFDGVKDACRRYEALLRIDRRDVFWSDAVVDATNWIAEKGGASKPMPSPESAYRPLYSTWYCHHHDVSAEKLERELSLACSLGMETVILDAGWQCDGDASGYSVAGDWEVAREKFPDMAAHVRRVHELGMKYMMWIAVPFVGFDTKAHRRFDGKFLYSDGRLRTSCLDPRFPEVREHLASTCERAMRAWGLDGLKLDFIDQIETRDRADPAVAENFKGRDVKTVAEGVELLMTEIARRVRAVKDDVLIEFRSAYFGPIMQSCGNMMRVADCPGQLAANRVGIVNLRLVCPHSCVHGDMIGWPVEASAEEAARYVLSSIFGTVQYSVALNGLDERKTEMLRHWITFTKRHQDALQKGTLRALHPECDYPVIEGSDGKESVILVSASGFAAEVSSNAPAFVLNNTGTGALLLRLPQGRVAVVRDTFGKEVSRHELSAGLSEVELPVAGYVEILGATRKTAPRTASFSDFDARARAGEKLTVVFFGGSLTWSANATEPNVTGFRGLMAKYLTEKYPAAHFTFVDAAIGGTGSNLGMFRLERDVLSKHPDLVFLDFACNDGGENTALAPTCCYEYLLREMIGRGIAVQQMFFTFKFWTKPGTEPAKVHPRREVYRRLVAAYGTPAGDVYEMPLWKRMNVGEVPLDKVWPIDGGHPDDIGYQMFADAGIAGFERGLREGAVCRVPKKPVFGTVKDLRRLNPAYGALPKGWTRKLTYRTSLWYDGLSSRWMEDVAAFAGVERSPLTVEATGNFFGVFGEADENALAAEVAADGQRIGQFNSYHRAGPGRLFFWRNVMLDGWEKGESRKHAFVVDPVPSDDGKGEFRVGAFCMATVVPTCHATAKNFGADDALNTIDHERGKAEK